MNFSSLKSFLFLSLIFSFFYAREYSCSDLDSIITEHYDNQNYEVAYSIAKANKDKSDCESLFYFHLGNIFKKFDNFNETRSL